MIPINRDRLEVKFTGYTKNLRERIKKHNNSEVSFSSKGMPWELVYYSAFVNEQDARHEERFLKSGKGRERRMLMLANFLKSLVD